MVIKAFKEGERLITRLHLIRISIFISVVTILRKHGLANYKEYKKKKAV